MSLTPSEAVSKIAKFETNLDRIDAIVNGDAATVVNTDGGPVPSLAKVVADTGWEAGSAAAAGASADAAESDRLEVATMVEAVQGINDATVIAAATKGTFPNPAAGVAAVANDEYFYALDGGTARIWRKVAGAAVDTGIAAITAAFLALSTSAAAIGATNLGNVQANLNVLLSGHPARFNVIDDDFTSDQTTNVQSWMTWCQTNRVTPITPYPIRARVSAPITYSGRAALASNQAQPDMHLGNLVLRSSAAVGFDFGLSSAVVDHARLDFPQVISTTIDWSGSPTTETQVGIIVRNVRLSDLFFKSVRYWTKGVLFLAKGFGSEQNVIHHGSYRDCKYGRVMMADGPDGYFNQNTFLGGEIGYSSATASQAHARFGEYFTAINGGDRGHNNNTFIGTSYQMGDTIFAPGLTAFEAVPVWLDGCGTYCRWINVRYEAGKGPFMHADAKAGVGNAVTAVCNQVELSVDGGTANQISAIRQVGGAYGSTCTSFRVQPVHWSTGNLANLMYTGGPATSVRVKPPFFIKEMLDFTPRRTPTVANRALTNRFGAQWNNGGIWARIPAHQIKTFKLWVAAQEGNQGVFHVAALDDNFNLLSGTSSAASVTDAYGTEKYIKLQGQQFATVYGGGEVGAAQNAHGQCWLTVRSEVKWLDIGCVSSTNAAVLYEWGLIGYPDYNTTGGALVHAGIGIIDPIQDGGGDQLFASVNPGPSGAPTATFGIHARGTVWNNSNMASGVAVGWTATIGGAFGVARADNTAYAVRGQIVRVGSNIYWVKVPGTTGTGTAPSGTAANTDYTDGTVTWQYFSPVIVTVPLSNLP